MRTRRENRGIKRQRVAIFQPSDLIPQEVGPRRKRICCGGGNTGESASIENPFMVTNFDRLDDDALISVLSKLSASAAAPSDLINVLLM
jgi:hypothetical protein